MAAFKSGAFRSGAWAGWAQSPISDLFAPGLFAPGLFGDLFSGGSVVSDFTASYEIEGLPGSNVLFNAGLFSNALFVAGLFGGSNGVVSDFVASYRVLGTTTNDLLPAYSIIGRVQRDLAANYNIGEVVPDQSLFGTGLFGSNLFGTGLFTQQATGPLARDLAVTYKVVGRVISDVTPIFYIRGPVQSDRLAAYSVVGPVQRDLAVSYSVSLVASDLACSYAVVGSVLTNLSLSYGILGASASLAELIQTLGPGSIVEMFEIDTSAITGTDTPDDHIYLHAGTNQLSQPVVWQGKIYNPFPVEATGFEMNTRGTLPRPRFRAANVSGIITALLGETDDLVGAKVIRRRTMAQYLDAINFPGSVNPSADPNQYFPDDVFYVERKITENKVVVEWELASAMDFQGVQLPSRVITINHCSWDYRSAECSYTGTNFFDVANNPVSSAVQDVCSKSVKGCKVRFGVNAVIPFGGFPAARTYKY